MKICKAVFPSALLAVVTLAIPANGAGPWPLESLAPAAVEVGSVKTGESAEPMDAPGVVEFGSWVNADGYWPEHRKVVKVVPEGFALPEGQPYRSARTDVFVVAGQPVTGVGLRAKTPTMYHWIEFPVPDGATKLKGRVLIADDPLGHARGYRQALNQNGTFIVMVDGKELLRKDYLRLAARDGSGEKLCDLDIVIPVDAKTVRLRLQHSGWGDGNNNTEVAIQAQFEE